MRSKIWDKRSQMIPRVSKKASANKSTLLFKFTHFLEDNPVYVLIWVLFVTITSVPQFIGGVNYLRNEINSSLFHKQILEKEIENLYTNVNINYFNRILGEPTIKSNLVNEKVEYVYVNKLYYVQAVTGLDNYVEYYTVTSRDKDFNPVINNPSDAEPASLKITLNRTTLEKFAKMPNVCFYGSAATSFIYYEGINTARMGNFQSIYYGIRPNGYIDIPWDSFPDNLKQKEFGSSIDCKLIPDKFRQRAVINTASVTRPWDYDAMGSESAMLKFGVSDNTVGPIGF